MSVLDAYFQPRGPCAMCGDPDARHRLFDAIRDRAKAGEDPLELAADYSLSLDAILAVIHSENTP